MSSQKNPDELVINANLEDSLYQAYVRFEHLGVAPAFDVRPTFNRPVSKAARQARKTELEKQVMLAVLELAALR